MSEDSQVLIPESFIALFLARGRARPNAPQAQIAARYELCEDMAQMLVEAARSSLFALSITEDLVLERMHQGLCAEGSAFSAAEAQWVIRRLAELLDWPQPQFAVQVP